MPQTHDYAHLGKTTWRAAVGIDDGDEPWARTIAEREYPAARPKGLAKAWINATLRDLPGPPPPKYDGASGQLYVARLERGTYRDTTFEDHAFGDGRVYDAAWEPDEIDGASIGFYAWRTDTGEVRWDGDA